jgi:hypothetical protein
MNQLRLAAMVRDISKAAPVVHREYVDQQAAFGAERAVEEKLLGSVIEMAKPALPAIANSIPSSRVSGVLLHEATDQNEHPLRVYVLEDGDLFETWESWVEEFDLWSERGAIRTASEVVEKYDVPKLVEALHAALTRQVGKRLPSTGRAKESAGKLNAILTLLDIPPAPVNYGSADDIPF